MSDSTKPRTQTEALTILARLTAEGGPTVEWTITTGTGGDHLQARGHLFATGPDAPLVQRVGLITWQRLIGAGPVSISTSEGYQRLAVSGSYEGLPVRVVTMLAVTEAVAA